MPIFRDKLRTHRRPPSVRTLRQAQLHQRRRSRRTRGRPRPGLSWRSQMEAQAQLLQGHLQQRGTSTPRAAKVAREERARARRRPALFRPTSNARRRPENTFAFLSTRRRSACSCRAPLSMPAGGARAHTRAMTAEPQATPVVEVRPRQNRNRARLIPRRVGPVCRGG